MPSTQLSEVHSASSLHVVLFFFRHVPSPSQVWPVAHLVSSVNLGTTAHVPSEPGTAQDWQVPHAALPQQTPLTQLLAAHSPAKVQALPRDLRQAPVSSQVESAWHVSSV